MTPAKYAMDEKKQEKESLGNTEFMSYSLKK